MQIQIEEIYLAGLISTDFPESLIWRDRVTPLLEEMGFIVRNPLHGKPNLKSMTNDGGMTATCATSKSIILRDRRDVRRSMMILCHLERFGSPRPLLGTIAELAWAWDQRTPVVGIAFPENDFMRQHPFMVEFISHYEPSEEGALAFIKRYYAPKK